MTEPGKIKHRTADLLRVLKELSEQNVTRPSEPRRADQFEGVSSSDPARSAPKEAWEAVVESSHAFWAAEAGKKEPAADEVARTLDSLEGVIASGEASALLEDWGRLLYGFETIFDGRLPPEVVSLLGELRDLLADRTRDFVITLQDDLLQSRETVLAILDEDGGAFARIILDALGKREPVDREVVDAATQNLRATLSEGDYRGANTSEIDVLAKRLEWLHAALSLDASSLGSRQNVEL